MFLTTLQDTKNSMQLKNVFILFQDKNLKWRNNMGIEVLTCWYRNKPATNPEKKKFTHAKVRVWPTRKYKHNQLSKICNYNNKGQAITPPRYSYIINNHSVLTKERKLGNLQYLGNNHWKVLLHHIHSHVWIREHLCLGIWSLTLRNMQ